ncbi:MAG: delta-lactam-biosynthetic de-N-acetylase [Ruminococcaceae bacterium]|nr:delta-lactam-biosynthetic de-N-acetylase [Oscillospiraceae bacterium]
MRRVLSYSLLLLLAAIFCMMQISAAGGGMSWYCVRQKAHRQPVIERDFSFIEDCGGYFIDHAHNEQNAEKVVYLTFDAGYENGNVAKTLDVLENAAVPGAFFILKHLISANPELVKRMEAQGHLVCNHTAHHPDLSGASGEVIEKEISELEESYAALTGKRMAPFFRPPEGRFSREMLEKVQEMGYKTVFWSFAYADWDNEKQPEPGKALQCIMDNVHNGAVLLLHPTSKTNAEILPRVIEELKKEGYRFGTLEELCGAF